jgi:hypothetical protein
MSPSAMVAAYHKAFRDEEKSKGETAPPNAAKHCVEAFRAWG